MESKNSYHIGEEILIKNNGAIFIPVWLNEVEDFSYVCICFNVRQNEQIIKKIVDENGDVWDATLDKYVKDGRPYISFSNIQWDDEFGNGTWYLDEDEPTAGGFSVDAAKDIAKSLEIAIEYVENWQKENPKK